MEEREYKFREREMREGRWKKTGESKKKKTKN